jgi:hypothetical protein
MSMADIKKHSFWLGVKTYEEFQGLRLHKNLVAQYTVEVFLVCCCHHDHGRLALADLQFALIARLE